MRGEAGLSYLIKGTMLRTVRSGHSSERDCSRSLMQQPSLAPWSVYKGGKRPTIVVSGTQSDPHAIGAAAGFILNLNRANVAFSRPQEKLIMVCVETLLDQSPAELEDYESAMLWKSLRSRCSRTIMESEISGVRVHVRAPIVQSCDWLLHESLCAVTFKKLNLGPAD